MTVHRTNQCGCCDIREKVKALWTRVQTMVTAVRVNGNTTAPDGNGLVDLGDIAPGANLEEYEEYCELTIYDCNLVSIADQGDYWTITVVR